MNEQEEHARRRASFDGDAAAYDGRSAYPADVLDRLRTRCGLGPGTRVLEVGPGTGQATLPLLAAAAEAHGLTVVHYDGDFDLITAVTGQPTEWVVPAGSIS